MSETPTPTPPPPLSSSASELLHAYREATPSPPAALSEQAKLLVDHYTSDSQIPADMQQRLRRRIFQPPAPSRWAFTQHTQTWAIAAAILLAATLGWQWRQELQLAIQSEATYSNSEASYDLFGRSPLEATKRRHAQKASSQPSNDVDPLDSPLQPATESASQAAFPVDPATTLNPDFVQNSLPAAETGNTIQNEATAELTAKQNSVRQKVSSAQPSNSATSPTKKPKKRRKQRATNSAQSSSQTEKSSAPVAKIDTLSQEMRLLQSARRAISGKHESLAEQYLHQYATTFPNGVLKPEHQALEIVVACQSKTPSKRSKGRKRANMPRHRWPLKFDAPATLPTNNSHSLGNSLATA